jgi:hypothetical protein
MEQLRELLIGELQDLLHAEMQLVQALPKMAEAAHHPNCGNVSLSIFSKPRVMSSVCANHWSFSAKRRSRNPARA